MSDPVIPRDQWRDTSYTGDALLDGMLNDLGRCDPALRSLGHRYVHLDANARYLIAETLAERIREARRDLTRNAAKSADVVKAVKRLRSIPVITQAASGWGDALSKAQDDLDDALERWEK